MCQGQVKTCTKVSFANEKYADFYINKLKKTSKRKVIPVRAYLCEKCFSWHLTSTMNVESDRAEVLKKHVVQLQNKCAKYKRQVNDLITTINEMKKQNEQD